VGSTWDLANACPLRTVDTTSRLHRLDARFGGSVAAGRSFDTTGVPPEAGSHGASKSDRDLMAGTVTCIDFLPTSFFAVGFADGTIEVGGGLVLPYGAASMGYRPPPLLFSRAAFSFSCRFAEGNGVVNADWPAGRCTGL
jgi:hypothetical protein